MSDFKKSLTTTGKPEDGEKKSLATTLQRAVTPVSLTPQKADPKALVVTRATGNIGFIIDATASRGGTWTEAQQIQKDMFSSVVKMGEMRIRLVHFGGDKMVAHEWQNNPGIVAAAMGSVTCVAGTTQYLESFKVFLNDKNNRPGSIIMIGDSFEENEMEMMDIAQRLKERGIKVFAFHEGSDRGAESVFRMIAETTGGTFAKFGNDMPLSSLCRAVAVYTVGGKSALDRMAASGDRAAAAIAGTKLRITGPS